MKTAASAVLSLVLALPASAVLASEPIRFAAVDPTEPTAVATHCTEEPGWCARLEQDGSGGISVELRAEGADAASIAMAFEDEVDLVDLSLWNWIAPLDDGSVLLGVEHLLSTFYSGGGGEASWLALYRIEPGASAAQPVLRIPVRGELSIRACFDAADSKERLNACSDEYTFSGILSFAEADGPLPVINYLAEASAFPAPVRRSQDSSELPPLTEADLVWAIDEACSFQRRFTYDAAQAVYTPDAPLPDCSDYTVP
jgi:hypothetical protein